MVTLCRTELIMLLCPQVLSTLTVISASMPIFMTVILPIAILYYFIQVHLLRYILQEKKRERKKETLLLLLGQVLEHNS